MLRIEVLSCGQKCLKIGNYVHQMMLSFGLLTRVANCQPGCCKRGCKSRWRLPVRSWSFTPRTLGLPSLTTQDESGCCDRSHIVIGFQVCMKIL